MASLSFLIYGDALLKSNNDRVSICKLCRMPKTTLNKYAVLADMDIRSIQIVIIVMRVNWFYGLWFVQCCIN